MSVRVCPVAAVSPAGALRTPLQEQRAQLAGCSGKRIGRAAHALGAGPGEVVRGPSQSSVRRPRGLLPQGRGQPLPPVFAEAPDLLLEWGGGGRGVLDPGLETSPLSLVHPGPPLYPQGPVPGFRGDKAQAGRPPQSRFSPAGLVLSGGRASVAAGQSGGLRRDLLSSSSCLES